MEYVIKIGAIKTIRCNIPNQMGRIRTKLNSQNSLIKIPKHFETEEYYYNIIYFKLENQHYHSSFTTLRSIFNIFLDMSGMWRTKVYTTSTFVIRRTDQPLQKTHFYTEGTILGQ